MQLPSLLMNIGNNAVIAARLTGFTFLDAGLNRRHRSSNTSFVIGFVGGMAGPEWFRFPAGQDVEQNTQMRMPATTNTDEFLAGIEPLVWIDEKFPDP